MAIWKKKAEAWSRSSAQDWPRPARRKPRTPGSCWKTWTSGSTRRSSGGSARTRASTNGPEQRARKAGPTLFDLDEPAEPHLRTSGPAASMRRRNGPWKGAELEIEREIQEEPDRIRQRYAVQTVRLEPVGIVYLWPEMG